MAFQHLWDLWFLEPPPLPQTEPPVSTWAQKSWILCASRYLDGESGSKPNGFDVVLPVFSGFDSGRIMQPATFLPFL